MKPESDPLTDDEVVIRFVRHAFFRPGTEMAVRPRAFQPRDDETTGISVYRAACLARPAAALAVVAPEKRNSYYLAAMPVSALRTLGITVRPDPIPAVPGHAVLAEVTSAAVAEDKERWKPLLEVLARLSSRQVIHSPSPDS